MSERPIACATTDCPLADRCRRKVAPDAAHPADTWHWRRSSFSDAVLCAGFEPTPIDAARDREHAHG